MQSGRITRDRTWYQVPGSFTKWYTGIPDTIDIEKDTSVHVYTVRRVRILFSPVRR